MTVTADPGVTHGMAELQPGVKLHSIEAGAGPRTIALLHCYPQTWWEWRHVIPGDDIEVIFSARRH